MGSNSDDKGLCQGENEPFHQIDYIVIVNEMNVRVKIEHRAAQRLTSRDDLRQLRMVFRMHSCNVDPKEDHFS
jgi:hypothetical protein